MREKLDKIINGTFGKQVEGFFGSVIYIVLAGVIGAICNTFDLVMVGTAVWTVLLIFVFIFCKNMFSLVPFLAMCTFILSKDTMIQSGYFDTPARKVVLILEFLLLVAALIFSMTYYKRWKSVFKKGYLTVSLCFVTAVLLMGGLGAEAYSVKGVLIAVGISATMFLPYSLLVNCGRYEGNKTVKYFSWTAVVAAVTVSIAVLNSFLTCPPELISHPKYFLQFGYAGPNTGAAFIVIALSLTFYLIYTYKHGYVLLPLAFFEEFMVAVMNSRASLIAISLLFAVLVIAVGVKRKKRLWWAYLAVFAVCAAVAAVILKLLWADIGDKLFDFLHEGADSGRFNLWKLGFDGWKETPIFGIGLPFLLDRDYPYYSFHNTPLTFLFCCGIVGLCAYIYHRYKTVRMVFSAKLSAERAFLALAILGMLINALLDIGMTYPQLLLYYSVMLAMIELDVRYTKENKLPDPIAETAIINTEGEKNE